MLSERGYKAMVWAAIGMGVVAFLDSLWLSMLLAPADASASVELTPLVVALAVLFPIFVGACIVLGYIAARRRPPRPERE